MVLWSHMLRVGDWNFLFKFQGFRLNIRTRGQDARVPNTALFVTFLDYDNIVGEFAEDPERRLREELEFIQDEMMLGNFYVFWTNRWGRHAVCLDCLPFRQVWETVYISSCDPLAKRAPTINEYRTWVLRTYNKGKRNPPKYLYTVESPYEGVNPQSMPHAEYLYEKFGLSLALKNPYYPPRWDGKIIEQSYNTSEKHVEDEELPAGSADAEGGD